MLLTVEWVSVWETAAPHLEESQPKPSKSFVVGPWKPEREFSQDFLYLVPKLPSD